MSRAHTAIITGASSGVGAATALALTDIGMDTALIARRRERLENLAAQIEGRHGHALVVDADLTDAARAAQAMQVALRGLGHVDVLVNCIGTNVPHRRLSELSIADWDKLVATNLSAVFYCIHSILPVMRERGSGLIISVSSMAGVRPGAISGSGYSAAKAGLNMLSACINVEEVVSGIRSCIIAPGDIDTEMLNLRPEPPSDSHRARMLRPDDVASLIVSVVQQPQRALVEQLTVRPV